MLIFYPFNIFAGLGSHLHLLASVNKHRNPNLNALEVGNTNTPIVGSDFVNWKPHAAKLGAVAVAVDSGMAQ